MTKEAKFFVAAVLFGLAILFAVVQIRNGPKMDATHERVMKDLDDEIDPDGKNRDRERAIPVRIVE